MLNTIKCEALVVAIAMLLAVCLMSGCKEAVAPIHPVQTHDHGEQEDPEEARRTAPPAPDPRRPPVELFEPVDDLVEW